MADVSVTVHQLVSVTASQKLTQVSTIFLKQYLNLGYLTEVDCKEYFNESFVLLLSLTVV